MSSDDKIRKSELWPGELEEIFGVLDGLFLESGDLSEEEGFYEEDLVPELQRLALIKAQVSQAASLDRLVCYFEMVSGTSRDYWSASGPRDADGKLVYRRGL